MNIEGSEGDYSGSGNTDMGGNNGKTDMGNVEVADKNTDRGVDTLTDMRGVTPGDNQDDASGNKPDEGGASTGDVAGKSESGDEGAENTAKDSEIDHRQDNKEQSQQDGSQDIESLKEDIVRIEDLEPDKIYEKNGYKCETNEQGQVKLVSGNLELKTGTRNVYEQGKVGRSGGVEGDEGGHMIGTRFNGPPDAFNVLPQSADLNRGAGSEWAAMEREWAAELDPEVDSEVYVVVEPVYGDNPKRPDSFNVMYEITDRDGKVSVFDKEFDNSSGTEG